METETTTATDARATASLNRYMTVLETANYLGVSKRFVYNAIASGELRHCKKSYRLIRIRKTDADAFMTAGEMGGNLSDN